MSKQEKIEAPQSAKPTGLDLLREPFPANQISKLPKPTKKQTDEVRNDFKKGIRCEICGGWHHPKVVHLDYVGHAALTDRLLDCDPNWNWEPMAFSDNGTPLQDENGGMWIKLTVCGVTRFGYGHPDGKRGGDAIKEVIGDALRNAAMRFGAALDLWHKGELHPAEPEASGNDQKTDETKPQADQESNSSSEPTADERIRDDMLSAFKKHGVDKVAADPRFKADLESLRKTSPDLASQVEAEISAQSASGESPVLDGDEIPYQNEGVAA